jgi:hypothetical protein
VDECNLRLTFPIPTPTLPLKGRESLLKLVMVCYEQQRCVTLSSASYA